MKNLHKITRALEMLRTIDPDMAINAALTLLYARDSENYPTQGDIEKRMGVSNAAMSRNVSYWSEFKKPGVPGKDYIEQRIDPMDRRTRVLKVKPAGRLFLTQLDEILGDK